MCGICGFFEKRNKVNKDTLQEMVNIQIHRGPDDQGSEVFSLFKQQDFAMGFDRLSIIDTSMNGHQPMISEDGKIYLTFNGEIYNAFAYKEELKKRGYRFHSTTDTEIILYLYEEYGIDGLLKRINGMFAICIADCRKRECYLIRDRFGVKPLYYWQNANTFLYASEYKCFFAHPEFDNKLNEKRLTESLLFRYVAGKETLLLGVNSVLPVHYLKIDSDYRIEEIEYWNLNKTMGGETDFCGYDSMLERVVRERLVSDVGLGVQLSGGGRFFLGFALCKKA